MDRVTENRYLEILLLLSKGKASVLEALQYIKLIEEPPECVRLVDLKAELDKIQEAHQAG